MTFFHTFTKYTYKLFISLNVENPTSLLLMIIL